MFGTLHVQKNRPLVYKYDDLYKASRRDGAEGGAARNLVENGHDEAR